MLDYVEAFANWVPTTFEGCLHGMMQTQRNHNMIIFTSTHFLCGFLDMWWKVCGENVQIKVNNILNSHYVVKLMHVWTFQFSIGIHFKIAIVHRNTTM